MQRREAALAAYRGGTGALAAVLDARRAELDAELALITQQQAVAKAWAFLNFVVPEGDMTSTFDSQHGAKLVAVAGALAAVGIAAATGYWLGTRQSPEHVVQGAVTQITATRR